MSLADAAGPIRPARREDLAAVLAHMRELADHEQLSHTFMATEADLDEALFGEHPAAECLVAEHQGEIVGYALFFHNYSTFLGRKGLYLEDLYLHPEHRGRGLGKLMLQTLAALATERRCGRFEWSVRSQPAIDFYEAMGADVLPDWRIVRVTGEGLTRLAQPAGAAD